MSILQPIYPKMRGRAGEVTTYVRNGLVVVRTRHSTFSGAPRSHRQKETCIRMHNLVNMWGCFPRGFRPGFENRRTGQTDYGAFLSHGMQAMPVYLTHWQAINKGCVVSPVMVSEGTLPAIAVHHDGIAPATDIAVGALAVDGDTEVCTLATAIVRCNRYFSYGDGVLFYWVEQLFDRSLVLPRVAVRCSFLELDASDERPLRRAVPHSEGFAVRGGVLAAGSEVEGGMAWVHLRRVKEKLLRSTQRLECNNPQLDSYSGEEALLAALGQNNKQIIDRP